MSSNVRIFYFAKCAHKGGGTERAVIVVVVGAGTVDVGLLIAAILMLLPYMCVAFNCIHQEFCDYRYLSALGQVLLVQLGHIWLAASVHSHGSTPFMGTVVARRCIWISSASDTHLVTGDMLFLRGPPSPCRSSPHLELAPQRQNNEGSFPSCACHPHSRTNQPVLPQAPG